MTKWGYQVQMRVKGKLKCFGTYKTLSEAKQVRISAEKEYRPYVKEIINMEHKPIYLDGVDVNKCKYRDSYTNFCLAEKDDIGETYTICTGTDCYFKQLARKAQECEQIKEKYEALKLENQEGYEIVAELKHECEELKEKYEEIKEDRYNLNMEMYTFDRYRKALEEIEGIVSKDYYDDTWADISIKLDEILDIISKAKDGE